MIQSIANREFEPGTTGWTVADLDDPHIQREWSFGRYEIVEGVLTKMAPQGIQGIRPLDRLRRQLERYLDSAGHPGECYTEVDLLLNDSRLVRPDLVYMTAEQIAQQEAMERQQQLDDREYRPLFVMPYLVVESVSAGHESHDRVTKRDWYREAGIAHFWLLAVADRSLECLTLRESGYVLDVSGRDDDVIRPLAFDQFSIRLGDLWPKPPR